MGLKLEQTVMKFILTEFLEFIMDGPDQQLYTH